MPIVIKLVVVLNNIVFLLFVSLFDFFVLDFCYDSVVFFLFLHFLVLHFSLFESLTFVIAYMLNF